MCHYSNCNVICGEYKYCRFHNAHIRRNGLCFNCLKKKENILYKLCFACYQEDKSKSSTCVKVGAQIPPARKCLMLAEALAVKEAGMSSKDKMPCSCTNGKTTVTLSAFGSNTPPKVTEMTCFNCCGSGLVSWSKFVGGFVWCKCKKFNSLNSIHASDGFDVFGNDTNICCHCGMVVQFGWNVNNQYWLSNIYKKNCKLPILFNIGCKMHKKKL